MNGTGEAEKRARAAQRAELARRRLVEARDRIATLEALAAERLGEIERLRAALDRLGEAHRLVLGSRSWRLTGPLRRVVARVRRSRRVLLP